MKVCSKTKSSGETSTLIIDIVSVKFSKILISQLNFTNVFADNFYYSFYKNLGEEKWELCIRSVTAHAGATALQ